MTTDERERLDDLRRQAAEFIRAGGHNERHNRRAGGDQRDRRLRNRRSRRQAKQRARQVWGIAG